MTDTYCRYQGGCVNCHEPRYRGDGDECPRCGFESDERTTIGRICARECSDCRSLTLVEFQRMERKAKQP